MANFSDLPREIKHLILKETPETLQIAQRLNRETALLTRDDYMWYQCTKPITTNEIRAYLNSYPIQFGYLAINFNSVELKNFGIHNYERISDIDQTLYNHLNVSCTIFGNGESKSLTHSNRRHIQNGWLESQSDLPLAYQNGKIMMFDLFTHYQILSRRVPCAILTQWQTIIKDLSFDLIDKAQKFLLSSTADLDTYDKLIHLYGSYLKLNADMLGIQNSYSYFYDYPYAVTADTIRKREITVNELYSRIENIWKSRIF